ncbi:RNA polymerase sigma factor [Sorangium sp. So ce385]|uniref:RNA polymerase sigma factor n=1 Tax=Sorangium sp. So ce385 TaxID=3133308 RepID=UPI003F5CA2D6
MSTLFSPADDPSHAPSWNSVHAAAMKLLPRSLRLLGVAEPDVDDLAQEVLLAAYESLDRFDPAYPAASPPPQEAGPAGDPPPQDARRQHGDAAARWVYGIAWRKVSHYLDRAYRRREVPNGLHPGPYHQAADPAPNSEERLAQREQRALAVEVLGTISPERRILLVLHEAYEVPIVDVARALGINYNTATNRLRLAREEYRAAVARLRPEQRQALRAGWLVFPLASDFLVRDGGASASAPGAPAPAPAAAGPSSAAAGPSSAAPGPPHSPPSPSPPAPPPRAPAPRSLQPTLRQLALALGSAAAGVAATVAVLLALAAPPALWARRFGPGLPELPPASVACLAAAPPPHSPATPEMPAPRSAAPLAEVLHLPCPAPSRDPQAAPPAGERDDTFAQERRLLTEAQERLSAGDPAGALRQLAAHEARFPAGRLKSVREQLRAVARTRPAASAPSAPSAPAGEPSR